ncbi:MAG TPA: phage major capsid protein [Vicinamibacterales bacterium]|nr:phage major capsid protein [Vicinamibacterales bacterium]
MAKALGHGDSMASQVISEGWLDVPQVEATLKLEGKAAVSPGTTTDATFAGPLAAYGISSEAIALERGVSIVGQLIPKMRRVPFRAKISAETGTGSSGAWVGEGAATPVAKSAYVSLSQEVFKAQTICALSKELLMVGNPAAEATIRETATAGMAAFIDGQFLTPTVTSSPGLRPAAVTNGAAVVVSTGTTGPAIAADLAAMLANITTGGSSLVWIMRPMTAFHIAAKLGGTDVPRTLFGIPLVLSANAPQQITLLDASIVLYSDYGAIDIATTDQASLIMDTAPGAVTQTAGAAPIHTALWQNDLWAVRISRWIAYQVARVGGVTYMSVTY